MSLFRNLRKERREILSNAIQIAIFTVGIATFLLFGRIMESIMRPQTAERPRSADAGRTGSHENPVQPTIVK